MQAKPEEIDLNGLLYNLTIQIIIFYIRSAIRSNLQQKGS